METKELEYNLRCLDQTVLNIGQSIQDTQNRISQSYSQADSLDLRAQTILNMASNEENQSTATHLYNQASAYMNQASSYRLQAEGLQLQLDEMVSELSGYKSEYQRYKEEGQINLANLKIAADQLVSVAKSRYGATSIKAALATTKQRIVYNQNLVNGCQKRICWIEQICGSSGDSYIKVKRK